MDNSDIELKDQYDWHRINRLKYYLEKEGIKISDDDLMHFLIEADKVQGRFDKRIEKAMSSFKLTDDVIQKIVAMNDGLYEQFRDAYNAVKEKKSRIEEEIASGELKVSGYTIYACFLFGYDHGEEGIPTATEKDIIYNLSDDTSYLYPKMYFNEKDILPDFEQWAEKTMKKISLDIPVLEDYKFYSFMKEIFFDAKTYCLADIKYLEPSDMCWDISVDYEHFDWDKEKTSFSAEDVRWTL